MAASSSTTRFMFVITPAVVNPTSLNKALSLPAGELRLTSRSAIRLWVRLMATSRSAIRGLPGMVMVEVTWPGPSGIVCGTSVEV